MYTLSRTMLQTDEGYNMLLIPNLIFQGYFVFFWFRKEKKKHISGAANYFLSKGKSQKLLFDSNFRRKK